MASRPGATNGDAETPGARRPAARRAVDPLRFTQLEIENWRNFKAAKLVLRRRAFLVGPNASGKSNLLDAFRFLRDLAKPDGGLQPAVAQP